jgi:selenide,water dikinase
MLRPLADSGQEDTRLLVGLRAPDDAGVFRLEDGTALVQTMDVITPVVDDPGDFGFIAAVNAMSDIYAMGGIPLTAMTFLAFTSCDLPTGLASEMLDGARQALDREKCVLLGGHTIDDPELKLGLSITGTATPGKLLIKGGAMPGDMIYLTKPLGTGIISTALKGEMHGEAQLASAVEWMKSSNGPASRLLVEHGVRAATDVTGFGLCGHLMEMCEVAGLGAELDLAAIPLMESIAGLVDSGMVPAGAYDNRSHFGSGVKAGSISEEALLPLYDPQTSGGLLAAVPPGHADIVELQMADEDIFFRRIGVFVSEHEGIKVFGDQ